MPVTKIHLLEGQFSEAWLDKVWNAIEEALVGNSPAPTSANCWRSSRSKWSQINRQRAEQLIAQGRMKPAGLAAV